MRVLRLAVAGSLVIVALQALPASGAEPPAAAPAAGATAGSGQVTRAVVTTAIQDREPVDAVTELGSEHSKAYYFTELTDMAGARVKHRWEYKDQVMAEVEFEVGGARWRLYSSKNLQPEWSGEWKASVIDAAGNPLAVSAFSYGATPAAGGSTQRPQ